MKLIFSMALISKTDNMMNLRLLLILLPILFSYTSGNSQDMDLPAKSPKAKVGYTIGYTTIEIAYSAPAVNDRDIWGTLVPYDKVWRAGANEATTISVSTDVVVEKQTLAAGTYSLFILPREKGAWLVIFNKVTDQWGAYNYDETQDALRVEVSPRFSKRGSVERLQYEVVGQDIENGYILLSWENLRIYIRLKVDAMEKAVAEIQKGITNSPEADRWKAEGKAADFLLSVGQPGPAFAYVERSLSLKKTSWAYWLKAQIHAELGDLKQAIKAAEDSEKTGNAQEQDNYYSSHEEEIKSRVIKWEEEMNK
jgi:tetratricopeptide (TPR) repeat protein